MAGYLKGTTAEAELRTVRAALHRAITAIQAAPDPDAAYEAALQLGELGKDIGQHELDLRAWIAASLADNFGRSLSEVARDLNISKSRAAQLVTAGRKKGDLMTDPGTDPEPMTVALAIVTRDGNVLIEHRRDRIPEWTFPGGEMLPGESPAEAVLRRVPEETGLTVTVSHIIGRRIHPRTGRAIVYLAAEAGPGEPILGDPEDLDAVEWHTIEETRTLLPDMYGPAREHLDA